MMTTMRQHVDTDGHDEDCPQRPARLIHHNYETTTDSTGGLADVDDCPDCHRLVACVRTCKQLQAERLFAEKSVAAEIARRKLEDARWRRACRRMLALQVAIVVVVTVIVLAIVI